MSIAIYSLSKNYMISGMWFTSKLPVSFFFLIIGKYILKQRKQSTKWATHACTTLKTCYKSTLYSSTQIKHNQA